MWRIDDRGEIIEEENEEVWKGGREKMILIRIKIEVKREYGNIINIVRDKGESIRLRVEEDRSNKEERNGKGKKKIRKIVIDNEEIGKGKIRIRKVKKRKRSRIDKNVVEGKIVGRKIEILSIENRGRRIDMRKKRKKRIKLEIDSKIEMRKSMIRLKKKEGNCIENKVMRKEIVGEVIEEFENGIIRNRIRRGRRLGMWRKGIGKEGRKRRLKIEMNKEEMREGEIKGRNIEEWIIGDKERKRWGEKEIEIV